MTSYFLGLDLGQAVDYTALSIIEQVRDTETYYHLRHLERSQLGTPYPAIVERVKTLMSAPEIFNKVVCVVDATGVGRPVIDMIRRQRINLLAPIMITGGDTYSKDDDGFFRVPKRDLVSNLQVLFQTGRLKIAQALPFADILVREMQNFRLKINLKSGHDSYEAWRESDHDDLVLSVALVGWYGEFVGAVPDHVMA